MYDKSCKNRLWLKSSRTRKRRGFSLSELVVSIGVLLLMFSLAGQVFNLTIHSTGQALAITNVRGQLRAFEHRLREDLRSVQRGESLILIQGNPVNAYWTQDRKDSDDYGDPRAVPERMDGGGNIIEPRADILMFFTTAKARSVVDPSLTCNLLQVVYGHAETGDWSYDPATRQYDVFQQANPEPNPAFPTSTVTNGTYPEDPTQLRPTPSPVAAELWHLARRSVLLVPQRHDPPPDPPGSSVVPLVGFHDDRLTRSDFDIFGNFLFHDWVLVPDMTVSPLPERFLPAIFDPINPFAIPPGMTGKYPFARSQLDEAPPAAKVPSALGHYFLPRCASFKVEWSLDPRSKFVDGRLDGLHEVLWFDPGSADPLASLDRAQQDPRNSILVQTNLGDLLTAVPYPENALPDWDAYSLQTRFRGTDYGPAPDPSAWVGPDGRANTVVFRAKVPRQDAAGTITFVPEDIFPHALRITVELYDSNGRLGKPTRHVIVVPVGS